jgi:alpha-L-fucosidase
MGTNNSVGRRSFMKTLGLTGGIAAACGTPSSLLAAKEPATAGAETQPEAASRAARLRWWQEAHFGMFIHWGLYSLIGRQEWTMEMEGVPISQYELLAKHFKPRPGAAREWAKLARRAGQKYMVMTTKHHDGFCLFNSQLTDYCAPKQAAARDLVREFVDAARAEGLRVGLYYSLMDWHHPDGARCATDPEARRRFVDYTHGLIRELLTNYGKIDILWYDVSLPLTPDQWESERMNRMVFELQPHIIVNNRNGLEGDFSTPEQKIESAQSGRAWEACMTLNDSWGYSAADDGWKSPRTVLTNLINCAKEGGNYLLNVGPEPDGTVPEASTRILSEVGRWLDTNGRAIFGTDRGSFGWGNYASYTRRGNTLYMHVYRWPGPTPAQEWLPFYQPGVVLAIAGLNAKVKSARMLATGTPVAFEQDALGVRLTGLPNHAPDSPLTVIEIECESVPSMNHEAMRDRWPRHNVGISSQNTPTSPFRPYEPQPSPQSIQP